MAIDAFLKIDGVMGESEDETMGGQIELASFSWGAHQLGSSDLGSGAGSGKVSMQDFNFVMRQNSASPTLFLICCTGDHIQNAILTCRRAGGSPQKFLEVTFTDILVSSYQTGGSNGGEIPMDQISLNFTKIEVDYLVQSKDGITKSAGKKAFNLKKNTGK